MHALKGAARMMGLQEIADACHEVEDLLERPDTAPRGQLEIHGDRLRSLINTLSDAGGSEHVDADTAAGSGGADLAGPSPPREELRVAYDVIDDLADRGARLRVVSVAAEGLADPRSDKWPWSSNQGNGSFGASATASSTRCFVSRYSP